MVTEWDANSTDGVALREHLEGALACVESISASPRCEHPGHRTHGYGKTWASRELSLVRTKLEEAQHWNAARPEAVEWREECEPDLDLLRQHVHDWNTTGGIQAHEALERIARELDIHL